MINKWKKFSNLSGRERSLSVQAFFLLPLFALSLRVLGMRRLHTFLVRLLPPNRPLSQNRDQILSWAHDVSRMVQIAGGRYPFHVSNCLTQAVTVWWLLRCGGIESDLRIGVRKEATQLKAHAWVEYDGHVLNKPGGNCSPFAPFPRAVLTGKVHAS